MPLFTKIMNADMLWPAVILAGAALQACSFIPALRKRGLRPWLISLGGLCVLLAAERERDHLTLVTQIAAWAWLWRGVVRSKQ